MVNWRQSKQDLPVVLSVVAVVAVLSLSAEEALPQAVLARKTVIRMLSLQYPLQVVQLVVVLSLSAAEAAPVVVLQEAVALVVVLLSAVVPAVVSLVAVSLEEAVLSQVARDLLLLAVLVRLVLLPRRASIPMLSLQYPLLSIRWPVALLLSCHR